MKPKLFIDFETQSDVPIKVAGSFRYVEGVDFRPVCMAYAVDDGPVKLWTVFGSTPFPIHLMQECTILAFNIEFEYNVLKSKWFEWNDIDTSWLTYDDFIDVQALGRIFGYPASLDKLAEVLRVRHKKDPKGTKLINQLCVVKNHNMLDYEDAPAKFEDLYDYCEKDVRATRACYNEFIKSDLSRYERGVFNHMMEQNELGFPIDIASVRQIYAMLERYKAMCNNEIYKLTAGQIAAGTQHVAIAQYIRSQGFTEVTSVAAPIVAQILEDKGLNAKCRKLLRLRQMVSHSSTAKFKRIVEMLNNDDRVQGNLKYYGGHTGRFAGVGVQIHNLPRAQVENPSVVIQDFFDLPLADLSRKYGNVGAIASKLIRPMIMAPESKILCVADYVSIENVCLHWTANDKQTIKEFSNRLDQYKTYAARRFNVHYDDVTKEQRTYAKPCVLGLGFGGGASALQRVALNHGIDLQVDVAETDKKFYRRTFPMIPKLWRRVNDLMIKATERHTIIDMHTGTCTIQFIGRRNYSFIILPSGRFLAYPRPKIQTDYQYGNPCFCYEGIDSHTKKWRLLGDQERIVKGLPMPDMVIHGGRLVENIIQAMARDLLVNGTMWAKKMDYPVIGSVHDEIITELDEDSVTGNTLDHFCSVICTLPEWATGLPLRADGYIEKRYRKG